MVKKRACVFISGRGSNLRSLIYNSRDPNFPVRINLVLCNNKKAPGINYAKKFSIPYKIIAGKINKFEQKALSEIVKKKISLICLAGFMKILSKNFLRKFNGKIINIHPSLLPKYKGLNTFKRALKNKDKYTGCTVHYVDEKLDNGKIISQKSFYIDKLDDEENLKSKTQRLEYLVFPESIIKIFRNY